MGNAKLKDNIEDSEVFADELAAGSTLMHGQYKIESFLNAGGFGITYAARDSLDRRVVIKECFPGAFCRRSTALVTARSRAHQNELASIVRLFVQEAKSLAKLDHPHIVGVHQVFEENNTAYMALDFVEGRDLLDIIEDEEATLEPAQVENILRKVLDAIDFIHEQGILHRDISPDNILMNSEGDPVLIDFGAAREQATKQSRVLSALRVVKDGYSPQEFYITGSEQGPYSDLYALGATFYHLLDGDLPPNSQARLAAVASGESDPYKPLTGRIAGYPEDMLRSIDKALAILPKDRIASATHWLAMMDGKAIVDETPTPDAAVASLSKVETKPKSRRGLLLATAATVAALAIGAATQTDWGQGLLGLGGAATDVAVDTPAVAPAPAATQDATPTLEETANVASEDTAEGTETAIVASEADAAAAETTADAPEDAPENVPVVASEQVTAPQDDAAQAELTAPADAQTAPQPGGDTIAEDGTDTLALATPPAQVQGPAAPVTSPRPPALPAVRSGDAQAGEVAEGAAPESPAVTFPAGEEPAELAARPDVPLPDAPLTDVPVLTAAAPVPAPLDTLEAAAPQIAQRAALPLPSEIEADLPATADTIVPPAPVAEAPAPVINGMLSSWAVVLPFDGLFEATEGETQIFAVNGVAVTTEDQFNAIIRRTIDAPDSGSVTLTVRMGATQDTAEDQNWNLPVVQRTELVNGLGFESTFEDGGWVTRVSKVPQGFTADLEVGDIIFGYISTSELLNERDSLAKILDRELEAGQSLFSFAITRGDATWAVSFPFEVAALDDTN